MQYSLGLVSGHSLGVDSFMMMVMMMPMPSSMMFVFFSWYFRRCVEVVDDTLLQPNSVVQIGKTAPVSWIVVASVIDDLSMLEVWQITS